MIYVPRKKTASSGSSITLINLFCPLLIGDNNNQFVIHNRVKAVSCLVFVAIFSHQLRDANRRGLWFSPVGSTPPIPYSLYILSIILLCVSIKYYLLMNSNTFSLPR